MVRLPTTQTVRRPVSEGYHALLTYGSDAGDDLYLQLTSAGGNPVSRQTVPVSSQGPNLAANPEDYRPESGRIFSRSGFSSGEGLDRAHKPGLTAWDADRFWASQNIKIGPSEPGVPEEVTLGWDIGTTTVRSGASSNPYAQRVANGTRIFWAHGVNVKWSDNLLAASPSITTEDPGSLAAGASSNTVLGLALDGRTLYAAVNTEGVLKRTSWAGAWSTWSDLLADQLWSVKGRILGTIDNVLYDVQADDDSIELKTIAADDTWTDIVDAGHLVLAAATDGLVYAFSQEAGALILRGETPMRPGEVPVSLGYADGIVFIGVADTNVAGGKVGRLYAASLQGVRLRGSRLLREWGDEDSTADHSPGRITVSRDEAFIPVLDDDGAIGIWSYLLETAGIYRRVYSSDSTQPSIAFNLDDKAVLFVEGADAYRELTDYISSGWLILPYADWYSSAIKRITGLRIDSEAIAAAGAQIDLYYSTNPESILDPNHSGWTLAKTLDSDETEEEDEIPLLEVSGRGITLKFVLTRSTDKASSPVLRSVSSRAFEDLSEVMIQLAVNVSDIIERPGKSPLRVPGRGSVVYEALREREGQPVTLLVLRDNETIKGRVEEVSKASPVVTQRGSSMMAATVSVKGIKA